VKRPDGELWWRAFNGKDWFVGVRADPEARGLPSPGYAAMMSHSCIGYLKIEGRYFEWRGLTKV
jgi:hypothetical protein